MPPRLTPGAPTPIPGDLSKTIENLRQLFLSNPDDETKYAVPIEPVPRPGYNTTGKEVELLVNCFPISHFPNKVIYQYEVSLIPSPNVALMLDAFGSTSTRGSNTMLETIVW